ncbi:MAG: hypothetical protein LPJ89_06650 [Hymenobacteraceae bacterium]|nr:hypothetical protein [Hymenobacteraceae bacterium]MDX5397450.1 hypothetical protein [Hymenobacteraceae bacterium]MDX5443450.1 hypothetical protein [Hymenobacteraceae bacterium]MDX5513528.1 hypothetical protein [Hymenobacteraceae bacterium]
MDRSGEILYDQNSILIVTVLFVLILLAHEAGQRIGMRYQKKTDADVKNQTNTIQAGTLGLLALILGFTFNMSLERYNDRSLAVIHEANAIGTAMMRTKLLPRPYDSIEYNLLRKYIDLRLEVSNASQIIVTKQRKLKAETKQLQTRMWLQAMNAAKVDPRPVTTGFFIESLNNMIDSQGERNALLQLHVPEVILFLLFAVFITAGGLMGYSSGLGNKRTTIPAIIMTFMISLVVFIIIDLDRPKRGIIKVNQESMLLLKNTSYSGDKPYRLKSSNS